MSPAPFGPRTDLEYHRCPLGAKVKPIASCENRARAADPVPV